MTFPFIKIKYENTNYSTFIEDWSYFYDFTSLDTLYTDRIQNVVLSKKDIELLFEWKNGMKINSHIKKQLSLDKITSRLKYINELKANFSFDFFNSKFSDISAIWKIFLLHIIQPDKFPIFDQHVYRAHIFLTTNEIKEIPTYQREKIKYYHDKYLPFFETIKLEMTDIRKIDKALWAFGKFLKSIYAKKLLQNLQATSVLQQAGFDGRNFDN